MANIIHQHNLATGSDLSRFRLTPNQNVIIDNIDDAIVDSIKSVLDQFHLSIDSIAPTAARLNSMACVALPTCGLALSESERFLPHLMDLIDQILIEAGLRNDPINVRMSGCPNGCSRPILAEIAFVGRSPGVYNLYLGASHNGDRLSSLYKDGLTPDQIISELSPIIHRYSKERNLQESFGDFCLRAAYVTHTNSPKDFHLIDLF